MGLTLVLAVSLPAAATSAQSVTQTLARVNQALQAGQADKALAQLQSLPQGGATVGEAENLACRVHYAEQVWDQATTECQQAVKLDAQNSVYHDWLGRALGAKASHASFLSAYSLGKQARAEFETAVKLNPKNSDALVDVGNFYQQAPGIVGGGVDKAQAIATQLDKVNPAQAHLLRANIAEGQKDYVTAEKEFKAAIAASAHPAEEWTDLASFYGRRARWTDLDAAIQSCEAAAEKDPGIGLAFYDGAGVLIEVKRNPTLAAKMLGEYVASSSKTEDAPLFEAHVRLANLKKQLGDLAGAKQEQAAALQLAHDYKPALSLKF
jgi:tetratricopeptide (TPR) repeat protein